MVWLYSMRQSIFLKRILNFINFIFNFRELPDPFMHTEILFFRS